MVLLLCQSLFGVGPTPLWFRMGNPTLGNPTQCNVVVVVVVVQTVYKARQLRANTTARHNAQIGTDRQLISWRSSKSSR